MNMYYYLDANKNPKECTLESAEFNMNTNDSKHVGLTHLWSKYITVSTVFLCINHNWGEGDPLLFETMVFPFEDQERYSTWEDAEAGHQKWVKKYSGVKGLLLFIWFRIRNKIDDMSSIKSY